MIPASCPVFIQLLVVGVLVLETTRGTSAFSILDSHWARVSVLQTVTSAKKSFISGSVRACAVACYKEATPCWQFSFDKKSKTCFLNPTLLPTFFANSLLHYSGQDKGHKCLNHLLDDGRNGVGCATPLCCLIGTLFTPQMTDYCPGNLICCFTTITFLC